MAKNSFVKPMPATDFPLGHARENKDASAYTGFKYPTGGGNDIGVYKQPVSFTEKPAKVRDPNSVTLRDSKPTDVAARVSLSNPDADHINPRGTGTMRGYGAATKGRKISGKMG